MTGEDERYERAKRRVDQVKGFYGHAATFLMVNVGLFVMNLLTSPGGWWFYWPLLGWGIGLAAHGTGVFLLEGVLGAEWEQRKIQEFMAKDKTTK